MFRLWTRLAGKTDRYGRLLLAYRLLLLLLLLVSFGLYVCIVLYNNRWDWDHFYSMMGVGMSGWLTELRPPTWSYQLCGGMSRIADPQDFALSPIFIPILILGPIAGTKAILLLLFAVGFYYLRKSALLILSTGESESGESEVIASGFAIMILTCNYFIWQIVAGHFTQMMMYLVFGLLYYNLRAIHGKLGAREWAAATMIGWVYFSGGIYHSLVFLWIPFAFGICAAYVIMSAGAALFRRANLRGMLVSGSRIFLLNLATILPGLYKILPVFLYQLDNARGGGSGYDMEPKLFSFIMFQLFPTIGPHIAFVKDLVTKNGVDYLYPIWELGAFSPISWLFLIAIVSVAIIAVRDREERLRLMERCRRADFCFFACFASLSFMFVMADFAPWSPYRLLNKYILQDSAHVTQRFNISVTVSAALLLIWLLAGSMKLRKLFTRIFLVPATCVGVASMWPFWSTYGPSGTYWVGPYVQPSAGFSGLPSFMDFPAGNTKSMKEAVIYGWAAWPPMYLELRQGRAFLNCYNPLRSEKAMWPLLDKTATELYNRGDPAAHVVLPLIAEGGPAGEECRRDSYFTQSRIHLDSTCQVGTCVNLNSINPADPIAGYLERIEDRYCLAKPLPSVP